jgi:hypothetical protein
MDGMLHGATIRSRVPCGRVLDIHCDPSNDWDEFVVMTAGDIPGKTKSVSLK